MGLINWTTIINPRSLDSRVRCHELSALLPVIRKEASLNSYDNSIHKAETKSLSRSLEFWYHHGSSTFELSPSMIIDIGHSIDQLEFKIFDQWFTVETTDSNVFILLATIEPYCGRGIFTPRSAITHVSP
jgi:hypothetical protein